ncbi:MAG: VCBS repeat-containing protein [Chitinophagaceae bacterium]|nr:VCBS repeat-containing protein [Chitinophagaceae bacterium]
MKSIKNRLFFSVSSTPFTFLLPAFACFLSVACAQNKSRDIKFRKHVLSNEYISEGVAVGDVNKDGKMDILAGTYWFEAPDWKKHEIIPGEQYDTKTYGNSFLNFSMDVNQDGWIDYIRVGFPGKATHWYENPKNKGGYWKEHLIYPNVGNESPSMVDIDGDGRLDLLCNDPVLKKNIWVKSPVKKGDTTWTAYTISSDTLQSTHMFTHGLGYGDINGDGRKDVVVREGWWEAPVDRTQPDWTFHKADLGAECSQMHVMDVDQDGDNDVIAASAHNYGIWWYEQVKNGNDITWKKHEIFTEFSQSHGSFFTDINKDGYPDLITGKRYYAHNGHDPGAEEPAVLYWFELKPGKTPQWIPHLVDNNSGAGLNLVVQDITKDKLADIIIGNKKGVFIFEQIR